MPIVRPTVVLFDIDGTLLESGGAGRAAMSAAFGQLWGRADACANISFGGMTDRAIARQGLLAVGENVDDTLIDQVLAAYLAQLEHTLPRHPHRVMPGVNVLLDALTERSDLALGLGTGNVRAGAFAKLRTASLDAYFAFGGFGCDAEDRAQLLRAGAQRGAERAGAALEECRVVVIGDTPKDVAAARAIGAEVVAVATGGFDLDTLRATQPDRAVADLTGFVL
jgi:phosphoglycolate phosphatase-like HAD superfamily hydrolase